MMAVSAMMLAEKGLLDVLERTAHGVSEEGAGRGIGDAHIAHDIVADAWR
jgi:hypothetical protein